MHGVIMAMLLVCIRCQIQDCASTPFPRPALVPYLTPHFICHDRYIGTVDYLWYSSHCHTSTAAPLIPPGEGGSAAPPLAGGGTVMGGASDSRVGLVPLQALLPPDPRRLPTGIPNQTWPSDHIALICDFMFTASDQSGPRTAL